MKKLLVFALAIATVGLFAGTDAQAQEGELEISGHVNIVNGWQRTHGGSGVGAAAIGSGLMNDGLIAAGAATDDDFGFFADEVEIDLAKSFGENIRLRADVDFTQAFRARGFGIASNVGLEQAYVTVNVPVGNGGELLFGRFNSGIGLDPIDRNELSTISFSTIHRMLLPHNMIGMDFYYGINENWSFDLFLVNDLQDGTLAVTTEIPSFGFTIGYAAGEPGEATEVTFTGAGGPEQPTKKHWSFLGDLAAAISVTEGFFIDIEALYRQDNHPAGGADNAQYIAGTLAFRYAFSDVWDGTLRYGFTWDLDSAQGGVATGYTVANPLAAAVGIGVAGVQHDLTLAAGYAITDGARFVLEGRYDLLSASAAGVANNHVYGVAGGFYYDF